MYKPDNERLRLESVTKAVVESFSTWHSDFKITEVAEKPKFRGSGIPHCPILWAYAMTTKNPRIDERGFMLEYTAEQGKVVHALMQKWLGIVGLMFGKWKCLKCNKIHPEASTGKTGLLGPVYCCNMPTEYEEYDMKVPRLEDFSGHCDGVLKIAGKYAPLEMKVRGTAEVASIIKSRDAVYKNVLQGTSYRYNLPRILYPTVGKDEWHDYVVMMYFDRADIRKKAVLFVPYEPKIFENEVLNVRRTRKLVEMKAYHLLQGYCKTAEDNKFCELHDVCFSANAMKQLDNLLPGFAKRASNGS